MTDEELIVALRMRAESDLCRAAAARIEALTADLAKVRRFLKRSRDEGGEAMHRAEKAEADLDAAVELTWRLRSYAVHDDDCKVNKPPHFDPTACSCGLSKALAKMEKRT